MGRQSLSSAGPTMAIAGIKAAVIVIILHHILHGSTDAAMYDASEKWQSHRVSGNLLQYQVNKHRLLYDRLCDAA